MNTRVGNHYAKWQSSSCAGAQVVQGPAHQPLIRRSGRELARTGAPGLTKSLVISQLHWLRCFVLPD